MENLTTNNLSKQETIKNSNDEDNFTLEARKKAREFLSYIQIVTNNFESHIDYGSRKENWELLYDYTDSMKLINKLSNEAIQFLEEIQDPILKEMNNKQ